MEILNLAEDAIVVANKDNMICYWNYGAECIFGYTAEEAVGQELCIIIPQRHNTDHKRAVMEYQEKRHVELLLHSLATNNLFALHKNGTEFPAEIIVCHFFFEGSIYFLGIVRKSPIESVVAGELNRLLPKMEKIVKTTDHLDDRLDESQEKLSWLEKLLSMFKSS